jgi:hypothetical protein
VSRRRLRGPGVARAGREPSAVPPAALVKLKVRACVRHLGPGIPASQPPPTSARPACSGKASAHTRWPHRRRPQRHRYRRRVPHRACGNARARPRRTSEPARIRCTADAHRAAAPHSSVTDAPMPAPAQEEGYSRGHAHASSLGRRLGQLAALARFTRRSSSQAGSSSVPSPVSPAESVLLSPVSSRASARSPGSDEPSVLRSQRSEPTAHRVPPGAAATSSSMRQGRRRSTHSGGDWPVSQRPAAWSPARAPAPLPEPRASTPSSRSGTPFLPELDLSKLSPCALQMYERLRMVNERLLGEQPKEGASA